MRMLLASGCMTRFLWFIAAVMLLTGCTATATVAPTTSQAARLRITNHSPYALQGLIVIFPEDRISYGDIPAGATTEYQPAPHGVYRYAAYQFILDGKQVDQPVVDWVGETPVTGVDFTYTLDFFPEQTGQKIKLIQATKD